MSKDLDASVRALADCGSAENEYWTHVSTQEELPVSTGAEVSPLVAGLEGVIGRLGAKKENVALVDFLAAELVNDPSLIHQLRLLVGVSDKRLYLELSYLFSRTLSPKGAGTLCGCLPHELTRHGTAVFENILKDSRKAPDRAKCAASVVAQYLVDKGLAEILNAYGTFNGDQRATVIENLILPKETQQNEAKRRGHGAEARFAELLRSLGCQFLPEDKIENPMGSHDPNLDRKTFEIRDRDPANTFSFDLVILDGGLPRVCVQGLVQSSDPGQFGVDKSNQTLEIRAAMDQFNALGKRAELHLCGVVDGVGYSENKEGTIHKMLKGFHHFVQMKSLFKAALLLHTLSLCRVRAIAFDAGFYSDKTMGQMCRYVPKDVLVLKALDEARPEWKRVSAGKAEIFL